MSARSCQRVARRATWPSTRSHARLPPSTATDTCTQLPRRASTVRTVREPNSVRSPRTATTRPPGRWCRRTRSCARTRRRSVAASGSRAGRAAAGPAWASTRRAASSPTTAAGGVARCLTRQESAAGRRGVSNAIGRRTIAAWPICVSSRSPPATSKRASRRAPTWPAARCATATRSCSACATGSRGTSRAARRSASRCCTRGPTGSARGATRSAAARSTSRAPRSSAPRGKSSRSTGRGPPLARAEERDLPIHGALPAGADWRVVDTTREAVWAELDWAADPARMAIFPFAHRLELRAVVDGGALTVETTVVATGADAVPMAFGFHPYLAPPGAPRERWEVELPEMAHLALDDRGLPTGAREPWPAQRLALGDRTFDDAFAIEAGGAPRFAVSDGARRIEVAFEQGFPYAQVFAPPGQALICFEPMAAPTDALRTHDGLRCVAPGERASAAFAIRVAAA